MALSEREIRLKIAEIAIQNGTKVDMQKDACLEVAEKIYKFVMGTTEKAPGANK